MKRIFGLALLATGLAATLDSSAFAKAPPGIGTPCRRAGRVESYWFQNPTNGPLYDYSSYFATVYPYIPGAQEYQWQATLPGQFGNAMAVLPTSPPYPPARPGTGNPPGTAPMRLTPQPTTAPPTGTPAPGAPTNTQSTTIQGTTIQSTPAQPLFRFRR
jgi:hypothetical protein